MTRFIPAFFLRLFILGLCVALYGCSGTSETPRKLSCLHFSMQKDPSTLDPRKGADLSTITLHFLMYEGLMKPKTEGGVELAIAKEVLISTDQLTYTFLLKDSLWSDGSPVTAYDFERSWKQTLSPSFPASNAHLFYLIKNAEKAKKGLCSTDRVAVKAKNTKVLEVSLEKPAPYFLEVLCFSCFHPFKELGNNHNSSEWIVNGPYKIKEWKFNRHLLLEKNPLYWNKNSVKTEAMHISIIDDENTALSMFEHNELDFIGGPLAPLPSDALITFATDQRLCIRPVAGSTVCFFNTQCFPFNNENIRKAFAYAIERQKITENVTLQKEAPASSIVPPLLKNGKSSVFFKEGNRTLARFYLQKGLEELNISAKDLNNLAYLYSGKQTHHRIAQVLQHAWKDVLGVSIQLVNLEHRILLERLSNHNFSFGQTLWLAQFDDPLAILERFKDQSGQKNYSQWSNKQFEALLEKSYFETDKKERLALLEKAEYLMLDQMPLFPLYHWNYTLLISDRVKNLSLSSVGSINFTEIVLDDTQDSQPILSMAR